MKTLGKCALGETGAQPARKGYLSRVQAAKTSTHLRPFDHYWEARHCHGDDEIAFAGWYIATP
jgi:hypothetical protein